MSRRSGHRSGNKTAATPLALVDAPGGESLLELAQARRDARSFTVDYSGMGAPPFIPEVHAHKQGKQYLTELKKQDKKRHGNGAPRLQRSLSVPFVNSWDFNSIDITSYMVVPSVGNVKAYLNKCWNRRSTGRSRTSRSVRADPRRLDEFSTESPEETKMFREKRHSSLKERSLDLLMEQDAQGVSRVAAGTPSVLVHCLLDVENTDDSFAHTVFLTHECWISSSQMLALLSEIYFGRATTEWLSKAQLEDASFVKVIKKRIIKLMTLWITDYFSDFRENQDLMHQFKEFVYELGGGSAEEKRMADVLLDTFMSSVSDAQGISSSSSDSITAIATTTSSGISASSSSVNAKRRSAKNQGGKERSARKLTFLELDTQMLAKQLCLFDQRQIGTVQFQELVLGNWTKGRNEHVVALRDKNTMITQWVATEILTTANSKQRNAVLTKFLELCGILIDLRNFGSCFNIYHGLRMPQVARLTKTWNSLDPKTMAVWQDLETQLRGSSTFFEKALAAQSPKILPMSLLLRFLEVRQQESDVHRKFVHMINFNKMRAISSLLKPFVESQATQYGFDENLSVQQYLEKYLVVVDSHKLTKLSREIEGASGGPVSAPKSIAQSIKGAVSFQDGGVSTKDTSPKDGSSTANATAATVTSAAASKPALHRESAIIFPPEKPPKTREEIQAEINTELISKWKRPLAKCSVGADLPRLVSKIHAIDARGHTIYKCRDDKRKFDCIREMNTFLRAIAQQLEATRECKAIDKTFKNYFSSPDSRQNGDVIKETGLFVSEALGEDSIVSSLLKVTSSQGIISPAWVRLKLFVLAGFPFKDARKGWRIYMIFEPFFVTVCHIKKEMSSEMMMGHSLFEFTWELKMVFDRKFEQMIESSLIISELRISDHMPGDKQLQLNEILKPWTGKSFRASIQYGLEGESEESSVMMEPKATTEAATAQPKVGSSKRASVEKREADNAQQGSPTGQTALSAVASPPRRAKSDVKLQQLQLDDKHAAERDKMKRRKSTKDKFNVEVKDLKITKHEPSTARPKLEGRSASRDSLKPDHHITRSKSRDALSSPEQSDEEEDARFMRSPTTLLKASKRSSTEKFKLPTSPPQSNSSPVLSNPTQSVLSPRRSGGGAAALSAISKASELLHDESESIDDAVIAHARRVAPRRGRSVSGGKQSAPQSISFALPQPASAAPAPSSPAASSLPTIAQSPPSARRSAGIVRDDPTTTAISPRNTDGGAPLSPLSSSGGIAGSGSDESSMAGDAPRKSGGSSHSRLDKSMRKSLELKNLDIVRSFAEQSAAGSGSSSHNKASARKSMPVQRPGVSKTPRGTSSTTPLQAVSAIAPTKRHKRTGSSGGPGSDLDSDELRRGPNSARTVSHKKHSSPRGPNSARQSGSMEKKSKDKDKEKKHKASSHRNTPRAGSLERQHSHQHIDTSTPRDDGVDSARDKADREIERDRERVRERERESDRNRDSASPTASPAESKNNSPREVSKVSPRQASSKTSSPRDPSSGPNSKNNSPRDPTTAATSSKNNSPRDPLRGSPRDHKSPRTSGGGGSSSGSTASGETLSVRRSRTASRSSRDGGLSSTFKVSDPAITNTSTQVDQQHDSPRADGQPVKRRPRAPSFSEDPTPFLPVPLRANSRERIVNELTSQPITIPLVSPPPEPLMSPKDVLPTPPPPVPVSSLTSPRTIQAGTSEPAAKLAVPAEWDVTESDMSEGSAEDSTESGASSDDNDDNNSARNAAIFKVDD